MFDFEKLELYQILHTHNMNLLKWIFNHEQNDEFLIEELRYCILEIEFKLAEGVSKMTTDTKKQFIMNARGMTFKTASILIMLKDMGVMSEAKYDQFYQGYTTVSKMLLGMYRSYDRKYN